MRYPVIVHKDGGSDYGVTVPDFPGVFSGGETLDEALANVQDAIETFYEGEEVERLPDPSPLERVLASEDAEGGAVVLVDVNFDFLEKKAVPVNITVPLYLRKQIDTTAKEQRLTRSAFLITAAKYYMQNGINYMSLSNKKQLLCEIIE
ncbi:type II toxin-antitoxin system HicB family antitoxin, partial [Bilophila wadsworthia]